MEIAFKIEEDVALKPYPNEHSCRIKDPELFRAPWARLQRTNSNGKKYDVIRGTLKETGKLTDQAYRYKKDTWSEEDARKHCNEHDGIKFEPANKEVSQIREGFFHAKILKSLDTDDKLFIEGYASTKDLDRDNEVVEPEAFAAGIENFLKNPILLYMHRPEMPIGNVTEIKIDPEAGFWIKAFISKAKDVTDIATKIKEGILRAFSIGFRILPEGVKIVEEVTHILKLDLWEVSIVSVPANQDALFSVSKAFERGNDLVIPERYIGKLVDERIKEVLEGIIITEPESGKKVVPEPAYSNLEKVLASIQKEEGTKKAAKFEKLLKK